MKDIYFDKNYGKLYEKVENGKAEIFEIKNKNGKISNQFIKRKIFIDLNDGKEWYDITTPYGYGGPIIDELTGNKELLLKEYQRSFSEYCERNNIVSEFVRFHPIFNNVEDFKDIYDIEYNRKTLGTNLGKYDDPILNEFSKSCRKNIRKKLNLGMSYRITVSPKELKEFQKCYYSTMDRNNAEDYYYFDDEYFENIKKYYKDNIILVETIYNNQIIAAGLYFICNKIIHIHLSGTLREYLYLSPAYILRYGISIWGKENGYEIIHHGGGKSTASDDTLYLFKEQFAQNTKFDFYVGKKIWNNVIYNKLCELTGNSLNEEYFPAYRRRFK